MNALHVSPWHFSLISRSSWPILHRSKTGPSGTRGGLDMAVILGVAKRTPVSSANLVPVQPASLVTRVAAALRRGADRRFTEQLVQIERTGRAGAF